MKRALVPRDAEPAAAAAGGDPRDRVPNANDPAGTVGPNVGPGFGDTHVMYPAGTWHSEAWDGWPVDWQTPVLETTPTHSTFFGYGRNDPGGYLRRVSTVGTCVDLQSRQLASFPAYGVRGGDTVTLPDWYQRSPEPALYADWCEFMKALVNSLLLTGEAILYATDRYAASSGGFPSRFIALNPNHIDVDEDGEYWSGDRAGGSWLNPADICHIKYQRDPGVTYRGIGPLAWAGRNLVSASELDQYASNIARYGVSAVLVAPGELTTENTDDLREQWAASRRKYPGIPAILSGGVEYTALSISPRDMALLDLKVFDLQMIAAALGVQPGLVGLPQSGGGLEYSSVDMLADHHWRAGLRPLAQAIAVPLANWLLPRGTGMEFNPDRYVQPGLEQRATAWSTLHGIVETVDGVERRAITVDEIRTFERWAPYTTAGGDDPDGDAAGDLAVAGQIGTPRG